jgi:hypothetical protein
LIQIKKLLLAYVCLAGLRLTAQTNVQLAMRPRLQWPNANGYCGETSIQMCGLYYGNYISQEVCRTVAGGEVLIHLNDTAALSALSFRYMEWDPSAATPQYQGYLNWVKQHLQQKHPVILTVYIKGLSDPDYDHILPAIGFRATSINTYAGTDQLSYNSCFDTTAFTRNFSTLYDTRSMSANGATNTYCIPQNVDYGVAVTGIKDPAGQTRPVHIVLDSLGEPNVSLGASARLMKAWITTDSLSAGTAYALLRYTNYQTVPASGFSPANANSTIYFTAAGINQTFRDSFLSNTAVFYRCIPYHPTDILVRATNTDPDFFVYPNPNSGNFTMHLPAMTDAWEVFDALGRSVYSGTGKEQNTVSVQILQAGIYFVQIQKQESVFRQRLIVY